MIIFDNRSGIVTIFCFIVFYFALSCSNSEHNRYVPKKYVVLSDEMLNKMGKKLSRKFQMTLIGEGGSFYDCVREFFLAFNIRGPLTEERLRGILVSCVEDVLTEVNNNAEIRPYLKVYPFTSKEITIRLFLVDELGREIYDPDIGVASARQGEIVYQTTDKNDTFKYKSIITESYEEALKIVEAKKNVNK